MGFLGFTLTIAGGFYKAFDFDFYWGIAYCSSSNLYGLICVNSSLLVGSIPAFSSSFIYRLNTEILASKILFYYYYQFWLNFGI